ncbi:MAG: phage portal protein [Sweet potato little leaf phytoplasma]|nr:phage portal protein [Sweet potato little leaf phytoplasma]
MRLLGFDISRSKRLAPSDDRRGWRRVVYEAFPGAWQKNVEVRAEDCLAYHAVFACMTLIASDVSKLRVKLVQQDDNGIWKETTNAAYSPVLRKPNPYQTRIQFFEGWLLSKLARGNTYVLKGRDGRGVVTSLHVLDPNRVKPMVSDRGEVFYELDVDALAGIDGPVIVPSKEIIHDRWNCIFHPLVGLSPIFANGLAATQGLKAQESAANLFANQATPGGIITAPGRIGEDSIKQLKDQWQSNYSGANAGKVAVLGDGLKFEGMSFSPKDAEIVQQQRWSAEVVCSTFHVPAYKVGVGQMPANSNVQSLNVEYYSQCLQSLIEAAELCLDEGLGIGEQFKLGTEFDVENLLRMDSATLVDVVQKSKGVLTLDEQRRKLDAGPVTGGGTIYLQQQDHSLAAIEARDRQLIAAADAPPAPPAAPAEPANDNPEAAVAASLALAAMVRRSFRQSEARNA